MEPTDIYIGVRDPDLNMVGKVKTELLDIKSNILHCGYGTWTLKLPREEPMAQALLTAGYGIQVLHKVGNDWPTLFSGPTISPSQTRTPEDPSGVITITGVTDEIILWDALAWGDPFNPIAAQSTSNDIRNGPAESIMKQYVDLNIGPGALSVRRGGLAQKLIIDTDMAMGPTIDKSPRFTNLGELLSEIARYSSMGFRVVQEGNNLVFKTYTIQDRSDFVRFDIENNSLSEETTALQAPGVTRTIVAGQGEGVERTLIERSTAESIEAEGDWGRVIERWIDQRQTDLIEELEQAGDEPLITSGFTGVAVKAVPTDTTNMRFGPDWGLGDIVSIAVNGSEAKSLITEMALVASSSGVDIGAALGDVTGFKASTSLQSQMSQTNNRVAALEKNSESIKADIDPNSNTLVKRDEEGDIFVNEPTEADHPTTKQYVDNLDITKVSEIVLTRYIADFIYTPPSNLLYAVVEITGGGGGGGGGATTASGEISGGAGGGGGEYVRKVFNRSALLPTVTVDIGARGTRGSSAGSAGGDGADTTFGSLLTAQGGRGGDYRQPTTSDIPRGGGRGGGYNTTPVSGEVRQPGQPGSSIFRFGSYGVAGNGGSAGSGSGGANAITSASGSGAYTGEDATGYGGGGSGAWVGSAAAGKVGGYGAQGVCVITEYRS
jgi:hypothetical protein